jgi:hypothetical protein
MELLGEIGRGVNAAFTQVNTYTSALSGTFTVTPDNVLAAAKIIATQASALQDKLESVRGDLIVTAPGDDDVSTKIAPAWNDILVHADDSYSNRIQLYIDGLTKLADQCKESAKAYGYTDEAIAQALGARGA